MIDRVEKAGDTVTVSFGPDPHVSTFSLRWLSAQRPGPQGDGRTEQDKRLWKANDLVGALPVKRWSAYCDEGAERARVLAWVVSLGFAILQEVPKQDGTVLEVVKSFGYVRETWRAVRGARGAVSEQSGFHRTRDCSPHRQPLP